jgi:hypothetical protein
MIKMLTMPGWDFFSAGQVSGEKINRSLIDVFARTPGVYSQAGNERFAQVQSLGGRHLPLQ